MNFKKRLTPAEQMTDGRKIGRINAVCQAIRFLSQQQGFQLDRVAASDLGSGWIALVIGI